jgi:hypothetical protein
MVVDQIDVHDIGVIETKDNPPVRGHGYAPESFQVTRKGMQTQPGEVHVLRHPRAVEIGENTRNFLPIDGVNLRSVITLVEAFQSAVTEAADRTAM